MKELIHLLFALPICFFISALFPDEGSPKRFTIAHLIILIVLFYTYLRVLEYIPAII